MIEGFALKAGLREDEAEEVVQETAISVAKHLPGFLYHPKVCAFKTWLLNLSTWRSVGCEQCCPGKPGAWRSLLDAHQGLI